MTGHNERRQRIGYIATREPEYSRVAIVRKGLAAHFEVQEILSSRRSYWRRMVSIVSQLIFFWLSGRLRRLDALVVGFFAQPVFPLVRLLYRGPIVADCYFSIFDTMVNDKRKASAGSLTGKLCRWLDRYMLRHAEMCLTDTLAHVAYLRSEFGVPDADVRRLWIGADCGSVARDIPGPSRDTVFEVFFWGGFIPLQGVDTIVRAAAQLQAAGEKIRFTIFGNGQTYNDCVGLAGSPGLTNLEFCGWQHSSAIAAQASKSHLALGIFGTTDKASRVIPNKAFEALAMGIPLITRRSPAINELLVDGVHARLVEEGNATELARAITACRDEWQATCAMASRGQELFQKECSQAECNRVIRNCIQDVLSPEIGKIPAPGVPRHAMTFPRSPGRSG
jgi:glycosyltransferase involved in cell wall biosynthesis